MPGESLGKGPVFMTTMLAYPLAAAEALGPRKGLYSGPPEGLASSPGVFRGEALITAPAAPSLRPAGISALSLARERFAGGIIRYS